MKKQIILAIALVLPSIGFAKVDFNSLIEENAKEQKQLHSTVQNAVSDTNRQEPRQRIVVVESAGKAYHSPSKAVSGLYQGKKTHKASEKRQFERLASELDAYEF